MGIIFDFSMVQRAAIMRGSYADIVLWHVNVLQALYYEVGSFHPGKNHTLREASPCIWNNTHLATH